jgi:hypothetical protein
MALAKAPICVEVRDSPLGGKGLFAAVDLPANTRLTEYCGFPRPLPRGPRSPAEYTHCLRDESFLIDGKRVSALIEDRRTGMDGVVRYDVPVLVRHKLGALANASLNHAGANAKLVWVGHLRRRAFLVTTKNVNASDELLWKYAPIILPAVGGNKSM